MDFDGDGLQFAYKPRLLGPPCPLEGAKSYQLLTWSTEVGGKDFEGDVGKV